MWYNKIPENSEQLACHSTTGWPARDAKWKINHNFFEQCIILVRHRTQERRPLDKLALLTTPVSIQQRTLIVLNRLHNALFRRRCRLPQSRRRRREFDTAASLPLPGHIITLNENHTRTRTQLGLANPTIGSLWTTLARCAANIFFIHISSVGAHTAASGVWRVACY